MSTIATILGQTDDRSWLHMDGWGGGWMWLWGAVMMTLFVVVVVWLVRTGAGDGSRHDPNDRAREILGERYARGELSTDEYRERIDALR